MYYYISTYAPFLFVSEEATNEGPNETNKSSYFLFYMALTYATTRTGAFLVREEYCSEPVLLHGVVREELQAQAVPVRCYNLEEKFEVVKGVRVISNAIKPDYERDLERDN